MTQTGSGEDRLPSLYSARPCVLLHYHILFVQKGPRDNSQLLLWTHGSIRSVSATNIEDATTCLFHTHQLQHSLPSTVVARQRHAELVREANQGSQDLTKGLSNIKCCLQSVDSDSWRAATAKIKCHLGRVQGSEHIRSTQFPNDSWGSCWGHFGRWIRRLHVKREAGKPKPYHDWQSLPYMGYSSISFSDRCLD